MMSTTPILSTPNSSGGTTPTSGAGLPNPQSLDNMFVQLLVAQLQNQDPLTPMDPSQFVGQLAQFSELSEVTSIYQLLQQAASGTGSGSGGSKGGTAPTSGGSTPAGTTSGGPAVPSALVPTTGAPIPYESSLLSSPALSAFTNKLSGGF